MFVDTVEMGVFVTGSQNKLMQRQIPDNDHF